MFETIRNAEGLTNILRHIINQGEAIMGQLDQLQTDVAAQKTVIDSAVTLLSGLSGSLKDAGTDPTKLAALAANLEANTANLAAAVTANTPSGAVTAPVQAAVDSTAAPAAAPQATDANPA